MNLPVSYVLVIFLDVMGPFVGPSASSVGSPSGFFNPPSPRPGEFKDRHDNITAVALVDAAKIFLINQWRLMVVFFRCFNFLSFFIFVSLYAL